MFRYYLKSTLSKKFTAWIDSIIKQINQPSPEIIIIKFWEERCKKMIMNFPNKMVIFFLNYGRCGLFNTAYIAVTKIIQLHQTKHYVVAADRLGLSNSISLVLEVCYLTADTLTFALAVTSNKTIFNTIMVIVWSCQILHTHFTTR